MFRKPHQSSQDKKRDVSVLGESSSSPKRAKPITSREPVPAPSCVNKSYSEPTGKTEKPSKSLFLSGLNICVVPRNFSKSRLDLFKQRIVEFGGTSIKFCGKTFYRLATHVILEEAVNLRDFLTSLAEMDYLDLHKHVLNHEDGVSFIKSQWLSSCLLTKRRQPELEYSLNKTLLAVLEEHFLPIKTVALPEALALGSCSAAVGDLPATPDKKDKARVSGKSPRLNRMRDDVHREQQSDFSESDLDSDMDMEDAETNGGDQVREHAARKIVSKFVCSKPSSSVTTNKNTHITDLLEKLMNSHKAAGQDFRSMAYGKAITTLKSHPTKITSAEEVAGLKNVGDGIGKKILEILDSGACRKVDAFCADNEQLQAVEMFSLIHGVSTKTATKWAAAGHRTLEDIQNSVQLTTVQQIGVKYYHDFVQRIPRSEVAQIEDTVRKAALELQDGLELVTCGSYRRGKPTCGDVDILVTHPDGKSHRGLFGPLLHKLHDIGFLTDDLSVGDEGSQKKYLGVCVLPDVGSKYRRLDIIVVPYQEFACALMYFTGSAHFNRSMRSYAHRLNMRLSHHSLDRNVVREGKTRLTNGESVSTLTEQAIFDQLGLQFLEPQERDH